MVARSKQGSRSTEQIRAPSEGTDRLTVELLQATAETMQQGRWTA